LGEKHRTEWLDILSQNNIQFQKAIVYQAITIPDLQIPKHILRLLSSSQTQTNNNNINIWWIFFSPNGIEIVLNYLCEQFGINKNQIAAIIKQNINCAAIGMTTSQKLEQLGLNNHASFYPIKPNPHMLFQSWKKKLEQQYSSSNQ
jgi:uroporphyrinogen-III synthase